MRNVRIYTRTFGDVTAYWHAPPTLREVLEWEVDIVWLGRTRPDDVATVYAVQQWLGRYVEIDSVRFNREHLRLFEFSDLLSLGWAVAASASFGASEIEPLRAVLRVNEGADEYDQALAELPCECPACRGEAHQDESCKFHGMNFLDRQLVDRLSLVASNPAWLDAPTWLYQFASSKKQYANEGMAAVRQRIDRRLAEEDAQRREREEQTERAAEIQREVFGRVLHGPQRGT